MHGSSAINRITMATTSDVNSLAHERDEKATTVNVRDATRTSATYCVTGNDVVNPPA